MCGIFYLYEPDQEQIKHTKTEVNRAIESIRHRGPDVTTVISREESKETMAFHRLSINGSTTLANQPMSLDGETYLLCNGEIYNHEALQRKYEINCITGSDCEIILHLFKKIGFDLTVKELDGEFAIVIVTPGYVYAARDPYGVRSLYISGTDGDFLGIASECKALYPLFKAESIGQFPAGHIMAWNKQKSSYDYIECYYIYTHSIDTTLKPDTLEEIECMKKTRKLLVNAVKKRMMCSRTIGSNGSNGSNANSNKNDKNDKAIGAYLSGGLDSSVIAAILQKELGNKKLETFSIGFSGSPDLRYAKIVAEHIGSAHHEVIITEEEALKAIPEVVKTIESYDITTIRASTMMYLLSKYIKQNTEIVVMFSGEGSDEASGSYRYFDNAPSDEEFHQESERLMKDLSYFDNLRADKSSAAWGLEIRVPFLDLDFIQYYMTLPRCIKTQKGLEKYLLRAAISSAEYNYLPDEIISRKKEAMSDGVSLHERSWSTIIQEAAKKEFYNVHDGLEAEKKMYNYYFNEYYKGCTKQIPYYWLPKWCGDMKDPSARLIRERQSSDFNGHETP